MRYHDWLRRIEDVAGHQKGVGLLGANKLAELLKERLVFSAPVQVVKDVAQMPVGSMNDFHN